MIFLISHVEAAVDGQFWPVRPAGFRQAWWPDLSVMSPGMAADAAGQSAGPLRCMTL
jgi:hypothetical protein